MSMTIGFVLRYDQAPAAPVPPSVASPTVHVGHVHTPPEVTMPAQGGSSSSSFFRQPSADRFPAYASTTYGSRGEPNRPWLPSQTRLDLYA